MGREGWRRVWALWVESRDERRGVWSVILREDGCGFWGDMGALEVSEVFFAAEKGV